MNDFWQKIIFRIGNFTLTPAKIAALLAVVFITWILLLLLKKIILSKKKLTVSQEGTRTSLYLLVKYFMWVITFSACISILGFNITILVASSAALLVGIGFGLQNIFSDLISGLFMLFEQKVKVGDVMEVDNIVGRVLHIKLRTSVLLTRDGYNIIVPNHKFINENVINWSHQSFDRRFHLEVGVSYSSDEILVTDTLLKCAEQQEELIKDEKQKPFVRLQDFGESALVFHLMFWTADIFRVEQVKSQLRYKIFKAFRENNISIPFPQRDIHIIKPV
jgi:small-conductance mechanosensitive channel